MRTLVVSTITLLAIALAGQASAADGKHKFNPRLMSKIVGGAEMFANGAGDMALPRDKFPGVKFLSSKTFFEQNPDRSKTPSGLYILDADFVPRALPDILKEQGLKLASDGSLTDAKGAKQTLLLWHHLVAPNQKQGMLDRNSHGWSWLDLVVPGARAATPYPLSYVSAWGSWRGESGFCRTVYADTGADAWGPLQAGDRPHTRIESIETRVALAHYRRNSCSSCDTSRSHDEWSVGCFWPAWAASGYHYANLKEGWFSWTWTWRW